MNLADPHAFSFIIRWLHVVAMTFMVGGAGLLALTAQARASDERAILNFASAYEGLFWLVLGIQGVTGVGNLGAFGQALPQPASGWGALFLLKLSVVLLLILLSLVRSVLVIFLDNAAGIRFRVPLPRLITIIYACTALVLIAVVWLAEGMAHG